MLASVFRSLPSVATRSPRSSAPAISNIAATPSVASVSAPIDRFVGTPSALRARSMTTSTPQRTALQKHADFFDRNNDGKITFGETREGLMALGIGSVRASAFALAINAGLSRATGASFWEPLTVYTDKIANGKHGSDTDIFDTQGNFSQAKFDELFAKYDLDRDNALSESEFKNFRERSYEDQASSFASKAEFDLLMELAGEKGANTEEMVLTRDRLAQFYDGTLFYKIAGEPIPF